MVAHSLKMKEADIQLTISLMVSFFLVCCLQPFCLFMGRKSREIQRLLPATESDVTSPIITDSSCHHMTSEYCLKLFNCGGNNHSIVRVTVTVFTIKTVHGISSEDHILGKPRRNCCCYSEVIQNKVLYLLCGA